jgi:cytochrome c556
MLRRILAISTLAIAGQSLLLPGLAVASETNPSIVYRQGIYKTVSGHMQSMNAILMLKREPASDLAYHAEAIVNAFKAMGNSYPAGSDKGDTKARPEIWTNMAKFREKGGAAFAAANEMVDAAQMGSASDQVAAFRKLGASCKSCHDDFRRK